MENTSSVHKPLLLENVGTVEELTDKIVAQLPNVCSSSIGMRISDTRMGTCQRKYFTDTLPYDAEFLYVTLYLKKHPPISFGKN